MKEIALAVMLLANNEPVHIWFNLLEYTPEHKWVYVDSLETLEECIDLRAFYETTKPGNYYCLPVQVKLT